MDIGALARKTAHMPHGPKPVASSGSAASTEIIGFTHEEQLVCKTGLRQSALRRPVLKKQFGLALAMYASVACAQAQSTVTVYGTLDAAMTLGGGGGKAKSEQRLDSGVGPGSRLGFRGNEDLGGGMRAMFVIEMGLDSGTGGLQQGGLAFGRQSLVGLGGKDWSVTMGRQYSPNLLAVYVTDALSQVYWGSSSAFALGVQGGSAAAGSGCQGTSSRVNNSVLGTYKVGSLTGRLMVSTGDENASGTGRFVNPSITYSEGPLLVNAGYGRLRQCVGDIPAGAAPEWQSEGNVGVAFDFNLAKVFAGHNFWDPSEANRTITATTSLKQTATWVGVVVPVGTANYMAQIARLKQVQRGGDAAGTSVGLVYEYALSKRTKAYVNAAKVWNDGRGRFGLVGATAVQSASAVGANPRTLSVGATHSF
jgi:GBP family porin